VGSPSFRSARSTNDFLSHSDRKGQREYPPEGHHPLPHHEKLKKGSEGDELGGSDRYQANPAGADLVKSPRSLRQTRKFQPTTPLATYSRAMSPMNVRPLSRVGSSNFMPPSRPGMERCNSKTATRHDFAKFNDAGVINPSTPLRVVPRSCSVGGLFPGSSEGGGNPPSRPLLAASPKDTSRRNVGMPSSDRLVTAPTGIPRSLLCPPNLGVTPSTPRTRSPPRGLPLAAQYSPKAGGFRKKSGGSHNRRGSLGDNTDVSPRRQEESRGRSNSRNHRTRNDGIKQGDIHEGSQEYEKAPRHSNHPDQRRSASRTRRNKISRSSAGRSQKIPGHDNEKAGALSMLYSTSEKLPAGKANSAAEETDAEVAGLGYSTFLTQDWSSQDVEKVVLTCPIAAESQPSSIAKKVMPPSTQEIVSPKVCPTAARESKDRRSEALRSLKDLLRSDQNRLKVEVKPDGTKCLVMDMTDLDTVIGEMAT